MTKETIELCPPTWLWNKALAPDMCEMILAASVEEEAHTGTTGIDGTVSELRNSKIKWLPTNSIAEAILYNHGLYANEQTQWYFNMGRPERVQVAEYGVGQHYGWHTDWMPLAKNSNVRKITVVTLLNDPSEFDGGELEIEGVGPLRLERGDIVAFPSFLQHRVVPVTRGARFSATCWISGPRTL